MLNDFLNKLKDELINRNIEDYEGILEFINEIINDRLEANESLEDILESFGSIEEVADNFTGTVTSKQKEVVKTDELKRLEFENINRISVESISYSFEIISHNEDKLIIEYKDNDNTYLDIKYKEGTLSIEQDFMISNKSYSFNSIGSFFKKGINVLNSWAGSTCKIYLPSDLIPKIDIENVSGKININGAITNKLNIENVSGAININTINSDIIDIESVSGSIKMNDIIASDKLLVENVSGAIEVNNLECKTIRAETVSGRINLTIIGNKDDYSIHTESLFKDNDIKGRSDSSIYIETVSGSVNYNFI